MQIPRWLISAGLASLLAISSAAAQSSALEPPDLGRFLRWGPVRVRPKVELRQLGYNDNIFANDLNRESDLQATVAPGVEGLLLIGHRAFVTFQNDVGFTVYRDNTDQNFTVYRNRARVTFPWRSFGLFVDGQLDNLLERPVDAQDIRAERDVSGLGAGLIFAPSDRTEFELGRIVRQFSFSDPDELVDAPVTIGDRLDREETTYTVKMRYRLVGRTSLTMESRFDRVRFEEDFSRGRSSNVDSFLPGIDFGLEGTLSGRIAVGRTTIRSRDPVFDTVRETVARASIVYRSSSRLSLRLDGNRLPRFAFQGDSVALLNSEVAVGATYFLNRLIGIDLGTRRGTLEFPGSIATVERKDRIQSYEGGLRLRISENALGRRTEYRLLVRRYRQDSSLDFLDQNRTTVGVDAVVGF